MHQDQPRGHWIIATVITEIPSLHGMTSHRKFTSIAGMLTSSALILPAILPYIAFLGIEFHFSLQTMPT